MNQLTFDEFLNGSKELIHCQLSPGFHWLRISSGHTPSEYMSSVHFALNGYDFLYLGANEKDEVMKNFDGPIKTIDWDDENVDFDEDLRAAVG
ncbi:hypothetical protein [Sporosarcina cyprini]|uniref:hypothetical protein n=1 Tax=Sporosarcina cyprini TaxID=2910523 RepID=UPI001EDEB166|nr:hypothetical protein [Sporosarcina cyprini]MCG3089153.1 hypothetical protein [Sporosarcina cyprini]